MPNTSPAVGCKKIESKLPPRSFVLRGYACAERDKMFIQACWHYFSKSLIYTPLAIIISQVLRYIPLWALGRLLVAAVSAQQSAVFATSPGDRLQTPAVTWQLAQHLLEIILFTYIPPYLASHSSLGKGSPWGVHLQPYPHFSCSATTPFSPQYLLRSSDLLGKPFTSFRLHFDFVLR